MADRTCSDSAAATCTDTVSTAAVSNEISPYSIGAKIGSQWVGSSTQRRYQQRQFFPSWLASKLGGGIRLFETLSHQH